MTKQHIGNQSERFIELDDLDRLQPEPRLFVGVGA
jgi:hypothetical protein